MSSYSITEPSKRQKWIAGFLVVLYAVNRWVLRKRGSRD